MAVRKHVPRRTGNDETVAVWGHGCPKCFRAAWYWKELPREGDVARASMAYCKKGFNQPEDNVSMSCQWCNYRFYAYELSRDRLSRFNYENGTYLGR